ncbi:hypothetical protein PISMIDRAFT_686111 [Pisolithus microcarpus 441]|uniref:Uncharacterized protein n=1 Tax=Pisolithus microcarpus 441 TaxID=765257 RepID=A0A0C9Z2T6_9AGAM|nr:hypothetical protein PISMIDRAFT_686111 [Pisolithus microcarpus 441]
MFPCFELCFHSAISIGVPLVTDPINTPGGMFQLARHVNFLQNKTQYRAIVVGHDGQIGSKCLSSTFSTSEICYSLVSSLAFVWGNHSGNAGAVDKASALIRQ